MNMKKTLSNKLIVLLFVLPLATTKAQTPEEAKSRRDRNTAFVMAETAKEWGMELPREEPTLHLLLRYRVQSELQMTLEQVTKIQELQAGILESYRMKADKITSDFVHALIPMDDQGRERARAEGVQQDQLHQLNRDVRESIFERIGLSVAHRERYLQILLQYQLNKEQWSAAVAVAGLDTSLEWRMELLRRYKQQREQLELKFERDKWELSASILGMAAQKNGNKLLGDPIRFLSPAESFQAIAAESAKDQRKANSEK